MIRGTRPAREGGDKGEEDGRRPPARKGGCPPAGRIRVGMAGPGETSGSPWIPLPVRACQGDNVKEEYY
jgi:hypothetical protein